MSAAAASVRRARCASSAAECSTPGGGIRLLRIVVVTAEGEARRSLGPFASPHGSTNEASTLGNTMLPSAYQPQVLPAFCLRSHSRSGA
jgi:hypothetical protein